MAKHTKTKKQESLAPPKDKQVGVRYAESEYKQVEARAQAKGMNVAEYLRHLSRRDLEHA